MYDNRLANHLISGMAGLLVLGLLAGCASSFTRQVLQHRKAYRQAFLDTPGAPLTAADVARLRFFPPDPRYRVEATLRLTPGDEPFAMASSAGDPQPYVRYAVAAFQLDGRTCSLSLYQSPRLMRLPPYRDLLFLPFRDATNGATTYGGGRYLDLRISDIREGRLTLDFNRAYNPYCAYRDDYPCPLPPPENHLDVAIEAGEMVFR